MQIIKLLTAIFCISIIVSGCSNDVFDTEEREELNRLGLTLRIGDLEYIESPYGSGSSGFYFGSISVKADEVYEEEETDSFIQYAVGGRNIIYFSRIVDDVEYPLDSARTYNCGGAEELFNPDIDGEHAIFNSDFLSGGENHFVERIFCVPIIATHVIHRVVDGDLKSREVRRVALSDLNNWNRMIKPKHDEVVSNL